MDKEVIDALIEEHKADPGRRILQKRLAEETTVMVHSQEALDMAISASNILFGKSTKEALEQLDEQTFLDVFDGVPQFLIEKDQLGQVASELFTASAAVFQSKREIREFIKTGALSLNKEKLGDDRMITAEDLIDGKYLLVQRGKKNYYLVVVK